MLTILRFSAKPCFLCASQEETVEVRFKDRSFAGVVCKEHLFELMKKRAKSLAKPRTDKTSSQA